ncbi:MAG: hypothetical protein SFW09_00365 [Hyphomicrobiaceae bacterium]|nr:hypothetical protein [Hyphomicrobiaceae bacterium]
MRGKSYRMRGSWLRDMAIGATLFLCIPVVTLPAVDGGRGWTLSEAFAGETIASRAVEVTAPPGPGADNAIVAVAQLRPAADPLLPRRLSDLAVLGLTFSLLVAFNLAFLRHLRRVSASPRRDEWRRRR